MLILAILDKEKDDAAKDGCEREHYQGAGMSNGNTDGGRGGILT